MGICSNCNFKGDVKPDCRRNPHLRKEDFICTNPQNAEIDFVTGESKPGSCRNKNNFGECLFYEPIIPYENLTQIENYLFNVSYDVLDYNFAKEYFKTKYPDYFGCSSLRKGDFFGRKYDWLYDESATFKVNVSGNGSRFASFGIAALHGLTKDFTEQVISGEIENLSDFKILPFMMLDGINEKGVTAAINVVPNDKGKTVGTVPDVKEKDKLCVFGLVRYVLDNFSSAKQAVKHLKNYVSIFVPETPSFHYECHFLIADKDESYVVEFINNELIYTLQDKPYITNFHLEGTELLPDSTNIDITTVEPFGMGVERYNIIADAYETLESLDDIRVLMDKLNYTKAYTLNENVWYTEFVGDYTDSGHNVLTTQSDPSEFTWILEHEKTRFANRSRDPSSEYYGTWQSVHSSIYDISRKTLYLKCQEEEKEYTLSFGGVSK